MRKSKFHWNKKNRLPIGVYLEREQVADPRNIGKDRPKTNRPKIKQRKKKSR